MIRLARISIADARAYFEKNSAFRGDFNLAICAKDDEGQIHGVIAFTADGEQCKKEQVSTDGNGQVGTLLYGGMMRTAMALAYEGVTF